MIKIFSKLKHILIVTVVLITLLFGILIFQQYNELDIRKLEIETESIISISNDFSIIYNFYQKLASTYYSESISQNGGLLNALNEYEFKASEDPSSNKNINDHLVSSFKNAVKDRFSYYKVYNSDDILISILSNESLEEKTNYYYKYPLYYNGNTVGYIEIGLSLSAFNETLRQLTGRKSFIIFNESEYEHIDELTMESKYRPSLFSPDFFVSNDAMDQYFKGLSYKDGETLTSISKSIKSIIYEDLHSSNDFVIHRNVDGHYYTLSFISFDLTLRGKGYFVNFEPNDVITDLHKNLTISLTLFVGLYLTLIFIIAFIYYILNYLYRFSYTDHLTKAYNRHKFFEVIERNIYDYHRYQYMFSFVLIDIDNFKQINDIHGHNTGDHVLINLVKVINDSLRTTDYVFRWGGEEFLILLSHCNADIGYQVAEKLRHNINQHDFNLPMNSKVTASFGVASYDNCKSIEQMISNADKALYYSKEHGKNRTTIFPFE